MQILIRRSFMIKTATNIIKGAFRPRSRTEQRFQKISWLQEKLLKHQEDAAVKNIAIGNVHFYYRRPYELLHSYKEIFGKEIYKFGTHRHNPLIIDCGSNIGLSVIYFSLCYPLSKIIAFEPDQKNFELLKLNVDRHRLKNVELNNTAVWNKNEEITFHANGSEASHIGMAGSGYKVKAVSLNNLLQQFDRIDFLKIDIEGAEYDVVKDCEGNLQKVEHLFLEYHGKAEETNKLNEILLVLQRSGFKLYIRNAADSLEFPFVQKNTNTIYDVQLNLFCYR